MQINKLNSLNFGGIYQTKQQPTSNPQAPKLNTLSHDTVSFSGSDDAPKISSNSDTIYYENAYKFFRNLSRVNPEYRKVLLTEPLTQAGSTPLMLAKEPQHTHVLIEAAKEYEPKVLEKMLTQQDNFGFSPLMLAKTPEQTQELVDEGKKLGILENMLIQENIYGKSPLMLAKTPKQTQTLINAGRECGVLENMLTQRDKSGYTPLMMARTPEQTQALIDAEIECGLVSLQ